MNKILIPAILSVTIAIAIIFATIPVEKASTVHTTLQTTIESGVDNQDRAIPFKVNISRTSSLDPTTRTFSILNSATGKDLSGSFIIQAIPNDISGDLTSASTFECGLVEQGNGVNFDNNASSGVTGNGTFTTTSGKGLAVGVDLINSNVGGVCMGTIFLNSGDE